MTRPVSLVEQLTAVVVDSVTAALDGSTAMLPALDAPDAGGARAALGELTDAAADLAAAPPDALEGAARAWWQRLDQVSARAFGGPAAFDALVVRLLDERFPRTAAYLSLGGVIVRSPDGEHTLDRERLAELIDDPALAVDEDAWDAVLADLGSSVSGRVVAVLVALLLLAPQTILALTRGDLRVSGLPVPPTDAPGPWRTLREKSGGWVSITVPSGDPAAPSPRPAGIFDLVADLEPDLSATVAIRSQRRASGAGTVTDFEMWLALAVARDRWELDLGDGWYLRVEPGLTVGFGHDGGWHGAFRQFLVAGDPEPPGPDDPVTVSFGRERSDGAPDVLVGPPYDTRIVVGDLGAYLKVREQTPVVELGVLLHDAALVLTNRWWRTFGITAELLRDGIRLDVDLDLAYVQGTGLVLGLGAGLDVTFHVDKEFFADGLVSPKLHSVRLVIPVRATADTFDVRAEVRFHASVRIGPAVLVVDGLGGWAGWWTEDGERRHVGFLPPTGAGFEIRTGPFTGGGFLDFTGGPNERFGGVLHIGVKAFDIVAFGLHELTGRPGDAARRSSFVAVLGVRFLPGIQVGFGIAITGFGGIIGIHRRADTDALRERLTSGAAGNLLFAEDPIRNAPALLGDLTALFPAADGVTVVGLTIQLSWLRVAGAALLSVDLGLLFEFPGPSKIVILGSARACLPPIKGVPHLLEMRLDVVGFVDLVRRSVEFDATLIKSKALYVFHLTGDAAFRLQWGTPSYMALTLGGFHPDYDPEPGIFPALTRVALTVDNPFPGVFLRIEAYLAVTSNTLQFGGRAEVGYKKGPLNIVGFLGLDALIQFDPFAFEVAVSAGVRLRWNETTLAGVRLEGVIRGPGPFEIIGRACFEILWFDICKTAEIRLGPTAGGGPAPPVASVVQALRAELTAASNLTAVGAEDRHVVVSPRPATGPRPLVSPVGTLQWAQRRVPLRLVLDRLEGAPLPRRQSVALTGDATQGPVHDWVSPGSYRDLPDAEALAAPAFERCEVGATVGFGVRTGAARSREVTVTEIRLPRPPRVGLPALRFLGLTLEGLVARTAAAQVRDTVARIRVRDPRAVVRGPDGSVLDDERTVSDAFARARGRGVPVRERDLVDLENF
ncbi:DUF6603 domain-containing protein [Actinomycetospora rhizophila]|uniref:DUF6603 domain-containing protein n=1 Tax=Actinomycetospora rhizophila TaxID=1416876 RepID=A0ABV9ZRT9_9PSEU